MNNENRRQELSALNVMFCLFVVMIHILSYPMEKFGPGSPVGNVLKYDLVMIPWRLMSFVVQGFVLLSGLKLFLGGRDQIKYTKYIKKRIFSIVIPYIMCFAVYYLYYMRTYSYPLDPRFIFDNLRQGSLAVHFYFIPLILQFDVLLPLWRKIINNFSPIFVIPAALFASSVFETGMISLLQVFFKEPVIVMNDRLFTTYMSFWLIGCYIGRYYTQFSALAKNNYKLIAFTFIMSTVSLATYSHYAFNWLAPVPAMNQIQYFYGIAAIIFLLATMQKLPDDIFYKIPLLPTIDKLSYGIYLWHILILLITDRNIIEKFGIESQGIAFVIRVAVVYVGTILLTYVISIFKKLIMIPFKKMKRLK